jgi:hypothetical protein
VGDTSSMCRATTSDNILLFYICLFLCMYFAVLGFELRASHLVVSQASSPLWLLVCFWDKVLLNFFPDWSWNCNSPTSTSWVAGIIAVYHHAQPVLKMLNLHLPHGLGILRHTTKRNERTCSDLNTNVHGRFICNNPKLETTQMAIWICMDR